MSDRGKLEAAIAEARMFLDEFPGVEVLPLHLMSQILENGGDALAIEEQLLQEREDKNDG